MKRQVLTLAPILAATLVTVEADASPPDASVIAYSDLSFTSADPATVLALKRSTSNKPFVVASGGNTAVDVSAIAAAQQQRKLSFGIRHRDDGTHGFTFAFGDNVLLVTCNGFQPAAATPKHEEVCYTADSCILLGAAALPGSVNLDPRFAGSKSYSLTIERHGAVVHKASGLKGAITIPDFEGSKEAGKRETLGVDFVYGAVRADAWTLVLRHEGHVVSITPDVAQSFSGLPAISLRTTGLEQVELVGAKAG